MSKASQFMLYPKNEFYADSSSQCEVNRQAAARSRVGHLLVESVDGGRLLAVVPDKLDAGDDDGECQTDEENHEDAADVSHAERAGLAGGTSIKE